MEINYGQVTFERLRKSIELGEIKIPPFQRTFDWSGKDMARFFNSIIGGEPFGSIMLWKDTSNKVPIEQTNKYFNALSEHASKNIANKNYLIDGQQRITSFLLLYLLNNRDKFKANYLTKAEGIFYSLENLKFYFSNQSKELSIPGSWFFESDFSNLRKKVWEQYSLDDSRLKRKDYETLEILQSVHSKFANIQIGETTVHSDNLDDVINVFTLINTRGKKLSPFNIVHANYAAKNIDLNAIFDDILKFKNSNPEQSLEKKWQFSKSELLILLYSAMEKTISNSKILELSGGGGISSREIKFLEVEFKPLILRLISLLKDLGFESLDFIPSMNIPNILISLLHNDFKGEMFKANDIKIIRSWIKLAIINERYVSGSDGIKQTGYTTDRKSLREAIRQGQSIAYTLPESKNWTLDKGDKFEANIIKFENYGSNSATYKYIVSRIMEKIPSFYTGKIVEIKNIDKMKNLNLHHIFPSGHPSYKEEEYIDSLANITPLESNANIKINNVNPKDYFNKLIEDKSISEFEMKNAFIEMEYLDDFDSFLNYRSEQISNLLNKLDNFE